jgi:hypothetical protein
MQMSDILLVAGFVVAVTALLTLYSNAKQKQTWTGTLIEKKVDSGTNYGGEDDLRSIQTYYILIFRTEAGKKVRFQANKNMYDAYAVGGRFIKKSGADFPEPLL